MGLVWLKESGVVLALLAVALIIPQELMSDEHTVTAAVPEVAVVLKVTMEPLIFVWITEELELFWIV